MKGWKTVTFNVVMALIAVVYAMNPDAEKPSVEQVQGGIDAAEGGFVAALSVGNIILRAITTSPIFKKEPE